MSARVRSSIGVPVSVRLILLVPIWASGLSLCVAFSYVAHDLSGWRTLLAGLGLAVYYVAFVLVPLLAADQLWKDAELGDGESGDE